MTKPTADYSSKQNANSPHTKIERPNQLNTLPSNQIPPNLSQKVSPINYTPSSPTVTNPAAARGRGLAFGFSGLASTRMGIMDSLFGAAGTRSYSDLASSERQFQV